MKKVLLTLLAVLAISAIGGTLDASAMPLVRRFPLPADFSYAGTTDIPNVTPVVEACSEDAVLVPLNYEPTNSDFASTYICVVLDDFANDATIRRLDRYMEWRRAQGW